MPASMHPLEPRLAALPDLPIMAPAPDAASEPLPEAASSDVRPEDARRYLLALAALNLSVYDWNIETGEIERPQLGRPLPRLYGGEPQTAAGWKAVIHPDDRGAYHAALIAHLKGATPRLDWQYRFRNSGGDWRWVRQYGIALRRPDGRAYRLVGATTDITESKQRDADLQAARAETERTRRHMQALLDNMSDGVGSAEADGTYITSNKAMFDLVNIPRERIVALGSMQNIWRYQYETGLVPKTAATADEHVAAQYALFSRADGSRQARQRPDGTWVERCFLRMPDDSRLVVVRDITELKQRETELARERDAAEAARAEAEAANQAKSTFLAVMSHEIRTPMNGVLGMLDVLERSVIGDGQRSIVATMRSSASALLRIIDDVLDFSRIEAGRLELEETPFSLSELLNGTTEALRPQAMNKGLELRAEITERSADLLIGDAVRVRQIVFNLVGNALKFTPAGSVHIRAASKPGDSDRHSVSLTVTDTGIGISAVQQARLFQPFAQADSSTTRRFGGSGLGLSIVRRLAQLMGGDVRVHSELGAGSTFTVTLSLREAPARQQPLTVPVPLPSVNEGPASGHVLVVDDHPINRQVLIGQLGLLGLAVDTAVDGVDALSMWRPGRYAAVLADMHMPRMDGYALAGAIRAREAEIGAARTPIVAVTANAMRGEQERCIEAGMDAYLAKPVAIDRLSSTLARWFAMPPPAEPAPGAVDRAVLRAWLGEDEAAIQTLLADFMNYAGQNVNEIRTALARPDMHAVVIAAHNLRGGALSVGVRALAHQAGQLEAAARSGDIAACHDVLATLTGELERAADAIAR